MIPKTKGHKNTTLTRGKLVFTFGLGVILLLVPIVLSYKNVLQLYTNYLLRMDNGTLLHQIMLRRLPSVKVQVFMFNVSNAEEFLAGTEDKIKLEEVGPFVYQEMRLNEDLVVNQKPGVMWMTPKLEFEFVPEESLSHPNETYLTLPNLPLLSITSLLGKSPFLVQKLFNIFVTSTGSKPFKKMNLQDMFWGYHDPIIDLSNKIAPGLIYFKTFGLIERLLDVETYDYQLELGTSDEQKFALKKSIRTKPKHPKKENDVDAYIEKIFTFENNTFEGAVFPPDMPPGFPINIYRTGFCHTVKVEDTGSRPMPYGGEARVYKVHHSVLNDTLQCDTTGWCPGGLKDASPCYFGLPVVVSKGHFLDADPRLLDKIEGLNPNRSMHDAEILIDPKIGVTTRLTVSAQASLFLANMAYSPETRRLHDTVLPITRFQIDSPSLSLIPEAEYALYFVYKQGPYTLLGAQIVCVICGLSLLVYSAWISQCLGRRRNIDFKDGATQKPLIK